MLSRAVAVLDARQLAGDARALVASSSVGKQAGRLHPSSARRLWQAHDWLVQHALLDGRGLAGLVSEAQLAAGRAEAAARDAGEV